MTGGSGMSVRAFYSGMFASVSFGLQLSLILIVDPSLQIVFTDSIQKAFLDTYGFIVVHL